MAESKAIFRIGGDASEFTAAIDTSIRKVDELTSATTKASQKIAKNFADQAAAARADLDLKKAAVVAARDAEKAISKVGLPTVPQSIGLKNAVKEAEENIKKLTKLQRDAQKLADQQRDFDLQQAYASTRLTKGAGAETELKAQVLGFSSQDAAKRRAEYEKDIALNQKFGMSVRATGYAMSLIPAQMTDIVTQLAGGQSPFLIMVQQGGQLKDMFGGIGPAIQAVGGYLARLVNPATLAAAAIGSIAFVLIKAENDFSKLNKALVLTGNYAGLTTGAFSDMAEDVGKTVDSVSKASTALIALVNSGRFTSDQLKNLSGSVVEFSKASGKSIEDVAKEFASIIDDPVQGIEKLSQKYNFLTLAIYQQIKALQDQGKAQEAVNLALDTFQSATATMTAEVKGELGTIEKAWDAIATSIGRAKDVVLGFGKAETLTGLTQSLTAIDAEIAKIEAKAPAARTPSDINFLQAQLETRKKLNAEIAKLTADQETRAKEAEKLRLQNEAIAADKSFTNLQKSFRSRQELREDEIKKAIEAGKKAQKSQLEIDALVANINEKYKDPVGRAVTDDAATRMLQNLREQEAAILAQLATTEQLTSAEKEHAKFVQLIADLKTKTVLTADQISLQNRQEEILAQLNLNIAAENQLRTQKEINTVIERGKQISESIAQAELSRAQQYQNQLGAVSQGREAFNRTREEIELRRSFQKEQERLTKGLSEGTIKTTAFEAEQAKINESLQVSIQNFKKYYEELDALQANWAVGAAAGFADYAASARNAAQASSNLIGSAFKGMEDALVTFVKTGKLSFSSLVDSILSDLVRMSLRQAVLGPISQLLGSFIGRGFGGATTIGSGSTAGGAGALSFPVQMADGGYTGDGGKYDVAGVVHRGEYVLNKEATSRIGIGSLDRLNRGYANGGYVGDSGMKGLQQGNVNINIKNEAGADGYRATATTTRNEAGLNIDLIVSRVVTNDMRNNGPMAQSMSGAFGLRRTA